MGRAPRIQFAGALYHVFHRGNRRERIFWDEADYAKFEEFMIEAMKWSGVLLYDWSLLPNHFHFLVETPAGNLAEFMQRLLTRYAKYFNGRHKKVGHVFQGRYGSRLCDKEQYFLELVRYVELNPYRLKKGTLAKLGEWKWSSLRYYMGLEEPPEGLKTAMERVLERFGDEVTGARRRLAQFLADGLKTSHWEDFYKVKANRYIGDDAFVERIKAQQGEPVRHDARRLRSVKNAETLGTYAADCFQVSESELYSPSQVRSLSRIRQAIVYVGRTKYRLTNLSLADYLQRTESAVSMTLRRMWQAGSEYPEVRTFLEHLEIKEPVGNCEV